MRFRLVYLAALLLAWVQCSSGPRPPSVASIDPNWHNGRTIIWAFECGFTLRHRAAAREGFDYWSRIAGRPVFIENKNCVGALPPRDSTELVVRIGDVDAFNKTTRFGTAGRIGTFKEINYYYLWTDLSDWRTQIGAARHEAGHALGLEHSSTERCLMYPTISTFLNMSKQACDEEIALVRRTYGRQ